MFGLGPTELLVIAVIVLFIFGAKRLPEIGKGLGGAIREFRNIKKESGSKGPSDATQNHKKAVAVINVPKSFEAKLGKKVMEQMPGIKKVIDVKNKIENVKKMIE